MREPISLIVGTGVPLRRANVDTDQIMPKQFLKRVERSGFGPFVFHDWRKAGDFVLDNPAYAGACVLVAGANFGCGSSREQAVWGLLDHGIAAVVAPSYAPIFAENAARSRLLTVALPVADCEDVGVLVETTPATTITIDIDAQRIRVGSWAADFPLDPRTREAFLLGVDDIERTLQLREAITAHADARPVWFPTTVDPSVPRPDKQAPDLATRTRRER